MEIQRKLYQDLLQWKQETRGKKALLLEGARRVGKSTLVEKFGREQYRSYILIDFNKAPKSVKDNSEKQLYGLRSVTSSQRGRNE